MYKIQRYKEIINAHSLTANLIMLSPLMLFVSLIYILSSMRVTHLVTISKIIKRLYK